MVIQEKEKHYSSSDDITEKMKEIPREDWVEYFLIYVGGYQDEETYTLAVNDFCSSRYGYFPEQDKLCKITAEFIHKLRFFNVKLLANIKVSKVIAVLILNTPHNSPNADRVFQNLKQKSLTFQAHPEINENLQHCLKVIPEFQASIAAYSSDKNENLPFDYDEIKHRSESLFQACSLTKNLYLFISQASNFRELRDLVAGIRST